MKALKTEEVNGKAYASIEDARRQIGEFIETIYNRQRLHSALGYKPPVEVRSRTASRSRQRQAMTKHRHSISVSQRRGAVQLRVTDIREPANTGRIRRRVRTQTPVRVSKVGARSKSAVDDRRR